MARKKINFLKIQMLFNVVFQLTIFFTFESKIKIQEGNFWERKI